MTKFVSGFISFVGRPNTGKSTLTNALVGEKIAITANQPETTRHTIRGVVNRENSQIILCDTPGIHRPRTLLGERLNELVKDTFSDVDVVGFTFPANEKLGPGDKWILTNLQNFAPKTPIVGIVTKIDKVSPDEVAAKLTEVYAFLQEGLAEAGHKQENIDVVPVSAKSGEQLDVLLNVFETYLPEGPQFYPEGHITDEDTHTRMAELIREAALGGLKHELPHSVAVTIDEVLPNRTRKGTTDVHAVIYLEREGQKKIIMGKDGRRWGRIIHNSRQSLCDLLGTNVYIDLRIKVLKNWQQDPKLLARLGF
ncbi:MAG: GTPase Era [Corynebacterium sp.]|nr:GTPase Era [Corynebacterium sp.]